MSQSYLLPENDGLIMRESGDYAKDKLRILERYIYRFITSMRSKPWRALYYIDLQAGPGKNIFDPSKEIRLGSPLIALTAKYPFTHYRFVEQNHDVFIALQKRINASDRLDRVKIFQGDCNIEVNHIVDEIQQLDKRYIKDQWPSLNMAFLDPEGLELQWQTVEKLGNIGRMDLIINFSTMGVNRNANQVLQKEQETKLDRFFGSSDWKEIYRGVADKNAAHLRRAMIDFYKQRLASLGYKIEFEQEMSPGEHVFRNRQNAQIYTLIFASKHPLGNNFWQSVMKEVSQPKLF